MNKNISPNVESTSTSIRSAASRLGPTVLLAAAALVAAVFLGSIGSGCSTLTTPGTITTVTSTNSAGVIAVISTTNGLALNPAVLTGIQIAAKLGTQIAIAQDPSATNSLALAAQAVLAISGSGNYTPANLATALSSVGGTGSVVTLLTDAVSLYSATYAQTVAAKLDSSVNWIPGIQAVAAGIQQGLLAGPLAIKL